jgi:hypothetical protein
MDILNSTSHMTQYIFNKLLAWTAVAAGPLNDRMSQIFHVWYFCLNPTHVLYEYEPNNEENMS